MGMGVKVQLPASTARVPLIRYNIMECRSNRYSEWERDRDVFSIQFEAD